MAGMSPDQVANWMSSMSTVVPNQVLHDLSTKIRGKQIDGFLFSDMANQHHLGDLRVENLTMLHGARIRKAWHQDFPDTVSLTSSGPASQASGPTAAGRSLTPTGAKGSGSGGGVRGRGRGLSQPPEDRLGLEPRPYGMDPDPPRTPPAHVSKNAAATLESKDGPWAKMVDFDDDRNGGSSEDMGRMNETLRPDNQAFNQTFPGLGRGFGEEQRGRFHGSSASTATMPGRESIQFSQQNSLNSQYEQPRQQQQPQARGQILQRPQQAPPMQKQFDAPDAPDWAMVYFVVERIVQHSNLDRSETYRAIRDLLPPQVWAELAGDDAFRESEASQQRGPPPRAGPRPDEWSGPGSFDMYAPPPRRSPAKATMVRGSIQGFFPDNEPAFDDRMRGPGPGGQDEVASLFRDEGPPQRPSPDRGVGRTPEDVPDMFQQQQTFGGPPGREDDIDAMPLNRGGGERWAQERPMPYDDERPLKPQQEQQQRPQQYADEGFEFSGRPPSDDHQDGSEALTFDFTSSSATPSRAKPKPPANVVARMSKGNVARRPDLNEEEDLFADPGRRQSQPRREAAPGWGDGGLEAHLKPVKPASGSGGGRARADSVEHVHRRPQEVAVLIRGLPESQVPEKVREALAIRVEDHQIDGGAFSDLVVRNALGDVGIQSPLHMMKISKFWKNVLEEDKFRIAAGEARAANHPVNPVPKAVKMIC